MKKMTSSVLIIVMFIAAFARAEDEYSETAKYSFEIYKQIHQYPELGKKEFKTAGLIKKELMTIGYTEFIDIPELPTCVIAVLDTKKDGLSIALRAELDARPGQEKSGLQYSSKIEGISHSCGHDAHASILLGSAKLLFSKKDTLSGRIYFIFQPAEETKGGADDIVNSKVFQNLSISRMFALHSVSGLPVGQISVSPGYIMAGSNYFTIELHGRSSHAAVPYEGSNMPMLVSDIISGLARIPSLEVDISSRPSVISVTYAEFGDKNASNVIPAQSTIKGTIRAYEPIDKQYSGKLSLRELLERKVLGLALLYDAKAEIKINTGSPPTNNDAALFTKIIPELQKSYSGVIDTKPYRGMFSEDYSYYTDKMPCLYFGWGVAKDTLGFENVHSEKFSIHPDALVYGVELMVKLATLN